MRSLIAFVLAISTVYFSFNDETIHYGGFISKSKTPIDSIALPKGSLPYTLRQDVELTHPQAPLSVSPVDKRVSTGVTVENLIGQSTDPLVVSNNAPELIESYTVEGLVGACAYNCND